MSIESASASEKGRLRHVDGLRGPAIAHATVWRLGLSVLVGAGAFVLSYILLHWRGYLAADFTWAWRGGHELLAGHNPYFDRMLSWRHPYPFDMPQDYPLPALLLGVPFSLLNPFLAGALFYGLGSGLLAYGILRSGEYHRLPVLVSPSVLIGAMVAQWAPLIMAAAFLPWLQVVTLCKPNLGLPLLMLWRRGWGPLLATAAVGIGTLLMLPLWPLYWYANAAGTGHLTPLLLFPGWFLLLAALRWRSREGKLLLWMAVVPQSIFFYDQTLLWLIPRTWRQSAIMFAFGWIGFSLWWVGIGGVRPHSGSGLQLRLGLFITLIFFYLPALGVVLAQGPLSGVPYLRRLRAGGEQAPHVPAASPRSPGAGEAMAVVPD